MVSKKNWIIGFLGISAVAVIMELIASFDSDPNTIPWTYLIIDNIPSWVGLPIIFFFAGWLVKHFTTKYKEKQK